MQSLRRARAAVVGLGLVIGAGSAGSQELLVNGGFEAGLAGWAAIAAPGSGGGLFAHGGGPGPVSGNPMIGPLSGSLYALTDMISAGAYSLSQGFVVLPGPILRAEFTFSLWNHNYSPGGTVIDPAGLTYTGGPNQHVRIDLLTGTATPFSTAASDVLATFYLDSDPYVPGDPFNPWVTYSYDIEGYFTGPGAYQVRFAEVDNMGFNHMGIDDVSVFIEVDPYPPDVIPEPATVGLVATGLIGFAAFVRRRRNSKG